MKRDELRTLGITDELIDKVMEMNGADVNALKAAIAKHETDLAAMTTERDGLKEQVAGRDADIAKLKEVGGANEALTKQLSDLQAKYDTDTAKLNGKLTAQAKKHAIETLFAGIEFTSNFARRAAMREFEAAELKFENGNFIGAAETIEKMRKDNPDAFKAKEEAQKPKFTNDKPTEHKDGNTNPFAFNFPKVK